MTEGASLGSTIGSFHYLTYYYLINHESPYIPLF